MKWLDKQAKTDPPGGRISITWGAGEVRGRSSVIADILILPSPISFWFFVGFRWAVNTKS